MSDSRVLPGRDDWAYLAQLQRQLQALECGEAIAPDDLLPARAIRLRVAGRQIGEGVRAARAADTRRGAERLLASTSRIVAAAEERCRPASISLAADFAAEREAGLPVFWSAAPVFCFRAWDLRGLLRGAVRPWPVPEYRAGCFGPGGEKHDASVPHTDGSCGYPPCGIYGYKKPSDLVEPLGLPGGSRRYAVGVVALTGKVVEHDRGFRASHARAVALAVVGAGSITFVEGRARLSRLFAAPERTLLDIAADDPSCVEALGARDTLRSRLIEYLEQVRLRGEVQAADG